jgi:hypothetical protein
MMNMIRNENVRMRNLYLGKKGVRNVSNLSEMKVKEIFFKWMKGK